MERSDDLEIFFATSNAGKVEEASEILGRAGISVRHFQFDYREMRSDSLEEIAQDAVTEAHRRCGKPVFVEDSGLFIDALNGFPGTYSGWVQRKVGSAGILKLMHGVSDRRARFEARIAYHDGEGVSVFAGACPGSIAESARGSSGFGYDPIFVPEGRSQTFAENIQLKNNLSHRYKSLLEFSNSLASERR
jgi:XTP/dITP diphosphohydrolase